MASEVVTFRAPDGSATRGEAEVVRWTPSFLAVQAGMWGVGGFLLGTACILIPVVHLVTTWALPLLGILMAVRTMRRKTHIAQPHGTCPSCNEKLELAGGAIDDPLWQVCPHCKTQLHVVPDAMDAQEPH